MPTDDPASSRDDPTRRLQRLGDAMEAFLRFRNGGAAAGDRERFLCENEDLRDLLEPLFADSDSDDGAAAGPDATPQALGPGRTLDDYRILREIGRGGMGTVYEAEQLSLRRRVALKVLHSHLAWSPHSIERFRREAAAASRLRHPGLVPIHDVGEWRGLHWFSMEFVAGTPLNERMRDVSLGVRSDIGRTAESAELVARVAEALQAAHAQGLVHRDIKPHNVMIGADGSVRLLDFGLVAGTEGQKDHSITGAFLGTPHYCSPEQIAGERVGPAADVFSLGILLYELLTATRPFDAENTNAVLRRITAGQFRRLRQVAPGVPRDLETICNKALEHVPADRYVDAGAMAADLRRFLRIEPILAAPPSTWTRSTKWVRRHRLRVALAATCAVLAIAAATAWSLHLRDSKEVTRQEGMLDQAEEVGFRSIEQTLTLLSDQIDRQPSPGARHEPRADELAALCEKFLAVRAAEPTRRARIAHAFWQLAGIYLHLGRAEPTLAACARARAILLAEPPTAEGEAAVQRQLGRICHREMLARQLVEPTAGEAEFTEACSHWRPVLARADRRPTDAIEFAATLLSRARNLADRPERRDEAERLLREGAALLAGDSLAVPEARVTAVRIDGMLAQVLLDRGRTREALTLFDDVLARTVDLATEPVAIVDRALAQSGRGEALQRLKRSDEAEQSLRASIATAEDALQDWPGSTSLRRRLLTSRVLLGNVLMVQNRIEDAEDVLRAGAAAVEPLPAAPSQLPWTERSVRADLDVQLANCLLLHPDIAPTDLAHARELLLEATDLLTALVAEHPTQISFHIDLGAAWNSLAALANEHGDSPGAVPFAEKAIARQRTALAAMPENRTAKKLLGIHHAQLAWALAGSGRPDEVAAAAAAVIEHAPREFAALRMAAEASTRAAIALPDAERAEAARVIAVTALDRIAAVNAKEARRLVADRRFQSLRDRDDFRSLQKRLETR